MAFTPEELVAIVGGAVLVAIVDGIYKFYRDKSRKVTPDWVYYERRIYPTQSGYPTQSRSFRIDLYKIDRNASIIHTGLDELAVEIERGEFLVLLDSHFSKLIIGEESV
ncbi:MAG: hypothetical protein HRT61_09860 [Ekhidna sp.]|nr:hypothetical protein [Ekhidna sp.]